jgi:ESS family glutamate:Na+ symporter
MNLDTYGTLVAASLVLLLGRQLVLRIAFLRIYSIPEPVVGGLLVALAAWLVNGLADAQVRFDSSLGMPLMLSFFACIGLNADIASLMRGGKPMVRFLFVVVGFLVVQNATGLLLASLQGQPPLLGLLAGSITLSGGHGTGIAWGKIFPKNTLCRQPAKLPWRQPPSGWFSGDCSAGLWPDSCCRACRHKRFGRSVGVIRRSSSNRLLCA